ncbi:ATP-binding protein [Basilea psittacipulmonis]|nr:ATP-binding protein [Basilea psittacipulmonis]
MTGYIKNRYIDNVVNSYLVTSINVIRKVALSVPEEERDSSIRELTGQQWYVYTRSSDDEALPFYLVDGQLRNFDDELDYGLNKEDPDNFIKIAFIIEDALHLPAHTIGLLNKRVPRIFVPLIVDENQPVKSWISIPVGNIRPPNLQSIVLVWAISTLFFLIFSLWYAVRISRPLLQLKIASEAFAEGKLAKVDPNGPAEIYDLGMSFNRMVKALNESENVKRTMLSGLPHDLKSPLARMLLRVEMCEDEFIRNGMKNDISEMKAIIEQFINYVQGSDISNYHFEKQNLVELILERQDHWNNVGIEVKFDSDIDEALAYVDILAISRVIDNLISNSIKYALPPVEIKLTSLPEQSSWSIVFSDHGQGIPEERREEALRAFSRLDSARTLTGSSGLGLTLAKLIIESHQGSLELGSTDSGALMVSITLPFAETFKLQIPPPHKKFFDRLTDCFV